MEIGNKTGGDMNQRVRDRQARYRAKRLAQGDHRLEVWIPADVMAAIDDLHTDYGDYCRPQLAVLALLRKALNLPKPGRNRNLWTL